jgi:hypothetical protein
MEHYSGTRNKSRNTLQQQVHLQCTLNALIVRWNTVMIMLMIFVRCEPFENILFKPLDKSCKREFLIHCKIWGPHGNDNKTLKMDAAYSTKKLVSTYPTTGWHIPEDSNLHLHSLKSVFYHEDRGNMFLRNVGIYPLDCKATHPRRQ